MNPDASNDWITVMLGRTAWLVPRTRADLPERLMRVSGPAESAPGERPRVRGIQFLPAQAGYPALALKEYRIRGPGARIRALCLGSPALREWRALTHLKAHGIAAPEALAVGRQSLLRPNSRAYLATAVVPDSVTLEDIVLGKAPPPIDRRTLAADLGRLIRALHDAGVRHCDLHAANLLVDPAGRIFIVDLHSARIKSACSRTDRDRDLVSLSGAFLIHGSRAERLRFLSAYLGGPVDRNALRKRARRLEAAAKERLFRFLRKFERRPLRPGRHFQPVNVHELTGIADRSPGALRLADFLGPFPDETLEAHGRMLHSSQKTAVYQLDVNEKAYIVKRYEKIGTQAGFDRLLRGSAARRSWVNYYRLYYRGVPVPKPVLFLEMPPQAPVCRSYLATETVPGAVRLDRYVHAADEPAKILIADRLARAIARMHRLFIRNRDMKAQNILVAPDGEVVFIDPDGVASMKDPFLDMMARDLMRLNVSFSGPKPISMPLRLRFLKAYVAHMRLQPSITRMFWREVFFLTWDKWGRWRRKSKRLRVKR